MPIDPDYYEMFDAEIKKNKHSRIQYFIAEKELNESKGALEGISKNSENEEFLKVKGAKQIRLDKIIAVNGKPGPAYDEYDSYANACMDCMGGMED